MNEPAHEMFFAEAQKCDMFIVSSLLEEQGFVACN